jgi:DeoR/GlpR family transcriptional regulator of sugar metabolism
MMDDNAPMSPSPTGAASAASPLKPRQRRILAHVEQIGSCSYQDLADLLAVSTMTVRRDVDELAARERVIKTLGGVQRASAPASFYEGNLRDRIRENAPRKRAIALAASQLLQRPQTLFVDGSTTCLELVRLLTQRPQGLTIVTNSTLVCHEFGRTDGGMIVGIGGQYDPASSSFTGPTAEENASRFFVDLAVFSAKGFVPEEGTYESVVGTLRIKQLIARQAARIALLVDSSKFDQRALSKVLDISDIDIVITDDGASPQSLECLRRMGKQVHIAHVDESQDPAHDA